MMILENEAGETAIPCIQCGGAGYVQRLDMSNIDDLGPIDPNLPLKIRRTCPTCLGSCVTILEE